MGGNLKPRQSIILFALIFLSLLFSGCSTLSNGRGWGQDAFHPIEMERIKRAAHNAFFDLQTLIPAAGAMIFAIDDWDDKASDWAVKHTPIFGDGEDARDASDNLRDVLLAEMIITTFATPSGDDPEQWTYSKLKGLSVVLAATGASSGMTSILKSATGRERPDESNDNSFPSTHASYAFAYSTLSNRNLDSINMPRKLKRTLQVGTILLATGVGWARVEGQKHYPSDVLASAALAHFLSKFIYDAFMNVPEDDRFDFIVFPHKDGMSAQLSFVF